MNKFLLTTLTLAALAVPATAANAATPLAQVAANSADGMTYFGTNSDDTVTIGVVAGRIAVDNASPLQANAGCLPVAGDNTRATCTIFRAADGANRPINAFGLDGEDSITSNAPIPMIAKGGPDSDKLIGGNRDDQLFGEAGDNDLVQGRGGADILSGGAGAHDLVTYSDKITPVFASLKDGVTSLNNGVANEKDQLSADLEDLGGSGASDTLSGNSGSNTLAGGGGNDILIGGFGADTLIGGNGNDLLLSNAELFGPLFDGAVDVLNGSAGEDTCGGAPSEGDTKTKCEF